MSLRSVIRRRDRSRGQSVVEFALVLPILLLLLAATIDFGRLFYAYVAVENAAKEGALYGARSPLCDDATNVNCARSRTTSPGTSRTRRRTSSTRTGTAC